MPTYSVFGLVIESDIGIAELEEHPHLGAASCRIHVRDGDAPPTDLYPLGDEPVFGDVWVHAYSTSFGYRVHFDDTGTFDVADDGRSITWWSHGRSPDEAVHTDIIGRVLALALHAMGVFTLHASAVDIDGAGLVFVAPKFHGKSTIASALVRAGARLISDDTVAVDSGSRPTLRAGVQRVRLWRDAAARLDWEAPIDAPAKITFAPQKTALVGLDRTPLDAVYVLAPRPPEREGQVAERTQCSTTLAAMSLVTFRKLGALLGGEAGGRSFEHAVAIAQCVPVYELSISRDLSRVEEAAMTIKGWHSSRLSG